MCGIAALLTTQHTPELPTWPFWGNAVASEHHVESFAPSLSNLIPRLTRRGPDDLIKQDISISAETKINTVSTILSLRGTTQIRTGEDKNTADDLILLFNGEIYSDGDDNNAISEDICDTSYIKKLISDVINDRGSKTTTGEEQRLLARLDRLRGPWTMIFWSPLTRRLYFGKDVLGRRSLLLNIKPQSHIFLTSVSPPYLDQNLHKYHSFAEVPPLGLSFIDLSDPTKPKFGVALRSSQPVVPTRLSTRTEVSKAFVAGSTEEMYVSFLPSKWLRSVGNSGLNKCLIPFSIHETNGSYPTDNVLLVVDQFVQVLRQAVRRRLMAKFRGENKRETVEDVGTSPSSEIKAKYALLFSGGIDSMVLARILDKEMPPGMPLPLVNVAFGDNEAAIAECPDRVSATAGVYELEEISTSGRQFELLRINVTSSEARSVLNDCVRPLVLPCAQPMDATIGTALWMAARARTDSDRRIAANVMDTVGVLFSGLGADELMAGYKGRHRTVFRTEGEDSVAREMDADLSRLWFRNLGRDDRVVADHGRELRHPFLDESLIEFVTGLPLVPFVCDLSLPDGVGDKSLLRRAAKVLGLSDDTANRSKRAIQFGSRSKQVIERKTG